MPKSDRAILRVLFPEVRAKLLQLLFSTPPEQYYVRELTNKTGLALHTVQDELRKLTAVRLLSNWSNGYHRFYRANRDHTLFVALVEIVQANAKLPKTKHAALHRPTRPRPSRKRSQPRYAKGLPRDFPARWDLFSKRNRD
jgi:predicted transcriptional regulator